MATEKQLQTLDKYVDTIHEILVDQVRGLRKCSDRQVARNRTLYARMLSQVLYEAPKIFTGQVSIMMVDRKLNDFRAKPCPEHYLSRQKGGELLLDLVDASLRSSGDPPKVLVKNIALTYCAVHYTTPEENALLKQYQRIHHDEDAYKRAGIILIEARDLFTKRGHSTQWKEQMLSKYAPIVEHHLTSIQLIHDNQHRGTE